MKITGYKVLIVLGMIILHSLPFIAYYFITGDEVLRFSVIMMSICLNLVIISVIKVYNKLFKKIDKKMKKEIKLW